MFLSHEAPTKYMLNDICLRWYYNKGDKLDGKDLIVALAKKGEFMYSKNHVH